jgi:hypothetical protein
VTAVAIAEAAGPFAENKDVARNLRQRLLIPALAGGGTVTIDFQGVELATQSFIHALVSDVVRSMGPSVIDSIVFKNCNEAIQGLIEIVIEYSQEGLQDD